MKGSDKAIMGGVLLLAVAAAFWMLILSPKRDQAAKLGEDIERLESSVAQQEQIAAFAAQARKGFPKYYSRVVVLGKAVPEEADSASLMVQVNSLSQESGIKFRAIKIAEGAVTAAAGEAPATPLEAATQPSVAEVPTEGGATGATGATTDTGTTPAATTTPATEATAANLPIGASVGPAGLSILPYELDFTGRFFDVAGFIEGIDGLVDPRDDGQVASDGRLMTIDGFALTQNPKSGFPNLLASFLITSYVTPPAQGLTGGATPVGPAPTTAPELTSTTSAGATP